MHVVFSRFQTVLTYVPHVLVMEVHFVDKVETNFVNSFTEQKWVI
jgi:hypothetical protein